MNAFTFSTASVGRAGGREYNEDAFGFRDGCWVVADGLGGHGGGEVASQMAVDAVLRALPDGTLSAADLSAAIDQADAELHVRQQVEPRLERMRTTLVVLISDGHAALWAHVGDSRLYHFRAGRIAVQTEDHSVPQALVRAGEIRPEEVRHHEDRNRLLRTLGNEGPPRPTLLAEPIALQAGDAFLLCTDGYWEYVTETEMEITLAKASDPDAWLHAMTARLLGRAAPDHDNFTALAVIVN